MIIKPVTKLATKEEILSAAHSVYVNELYNYVTYLFTTFTTIKPDIEKFEIKHWRHQRYSLRIILKDKRCFDISTDGLNEIQDQISIRYVYFQDIEPTFKVMYNILELLSKEAFLGINFEKKYDPDVLTKIYIKN